MIAFSDVRGAIFDLDDTLLDNGPIDKPEEWLHSRSRLAAVHEVAKKHGIQPLIELTAQENARAFVTAAVHSLHGGVWNILFIKGLAPDKHVDPSSPLFPLVEEIVARKNELHDDILRAFGAEVPGASVFVQNLAANELTEQLALATSAIQRDITVFLDKYDLHKYFPAKRIISAEKVTSPKPDPECFELAFRSLDLPDSARRYVLAFEDNPRGVQSAKGAGLFVCAITTRCKADDPQLLAAKPDLIADSYEDFTQLLGIPTAHKK